MKKYLKIVGLIIIALIIVTGCKKETEPNEITTKYIGDNSKVSQIANKLPYPEGVTCEHIEIQSKEQPYELKIYLKIDKNKNVNLIECADEAFKKIENMGKISFLNTDEKLIESFERN